VRLKSGKDLKTFQNQNKPMSKKPDSPMLAQHKALASSLPEGHLLAFRLGDFYEFFDRDAVIVAPLLEVALTKRGGTPMVGIPCHAADRYIGKLVDAGKSVSIAEQVGAAEPGKLVERAVVEVRTPPTSKKPPKRKRPKSWTAKITKGEMALHLCTDLLKKFRQLESMSEGRTEQIGEGLIDGLKNATIPHPMAGIPPVRKSMDPDYCSGFEVGATWRKVAQEWEAVEKVPDTR